MSCGHLSHFTSPARSPIPPARQLTPQGSSPLQAPHSPGREQGDTRAQGPLRGCSRRTPQALSPPHLPLACAGLQTAPRGGTFNPGTFRSQRANTNPLPSATFATGQGAPSPPGTALWGPQGWGTPLAWADRRAPQDHLQLFVPYKGQRTVAAPAPPVLPLPLPGYHHLKGPYTQHSLSSTALGSASPPVNPTPKDNGSGPGTDITLDTDVPMEEGTLLDGDISLASDVTMEEDALPCGDISPSPSATLHVHATIRDDTAIPAGNIALPKEMLLDGAKRCLHSSPRAVGISQGGPSCVPMPKDPAIPHHEISSHALPEKMLPTDYGVPSTSKAILSVEHSNTTRVKLKVPQQDAGTDLPRLQGSTSQPNITRDEQGKKHLNGSLPRKASKRKGPALSAPERVWE